MFTSIETPRLILRTWKASDAFEYYAINQDPQVIAFLRGSLTMSQVNDFIADMNRQQENRGYTLWALESKETAELLGFVGLNYTDWASHFTPAVEIGWRLGSQYWSQGYATEGAQAALAYGFKNCGLKEIISFTVAANTRSTRVMEKIGLQRDYRGDFAHPKLEPAHRLSQHVLYRLSAKDYMSIST